MVLYPRFLLCCLTSWTLFLLWLIFPRPAPFANNTLNPFHDRPHTFKINRVAVSLLLYRNREAVSYMLETFFDSDIFWNHVELFIWTNDINTWNASSFNIKNNNLSRSVPIHWFYSKTGNEGIVIPRIRLMDAIIASTPSFDYAVEIHGDMTFPRIWFQPLLLHDEPEYAILSPFILTDYSDVLILKREEMKRILEENNLVQDQIAVNPIQVHPWVLKPKILREIGFYDSNFAPEDGEDDDLLFRVIKGGYKYVAVQQSWVAHRGMSERVGSNRLEEHLTYFRMKHGISMRDFQREKLCARAVWRVRSNSFENKLSSFW